MDDDKRFGLSYLTRDQEKLFPSLASRIKQLEAELAALRTEHAREMDRHDKRETDLELMVQAAATPAPGSWAWALEQMKAGRVIKRRHWAAADPRLTLEHPRMASLSLADVQATDWQLAEQEAQP